MTQNPFDALGGFDLGGLLQQAQRMQADLAAAQERLAAATVEGSVAGGAVRATLKGGGELTAVVISPDAVSGTDPDALAELGDLVVAAVRDARAKVDSLAEEVLGPLAGGLPDVPGLPGLPGAGPDGPAGPLGFGAP